MANYYLPNVQKGQIEAVEKIYRKEDSSVEDVLRAIREFCLETRHEEIQWLYEMFCVLFESTGEPVTIFVNDKKKVSGEPCFDYRVGTQILPHGSWVVGFFTKEAVSFQMPYLKNKVQERNLFEVLAKALYASGRFEEPTKLWLVRTA